MNTDVWWKHPVVYQVNPINFSPAEGSGLHGVVQHLDYIRSLGADALLLTTLQPDPAHAQSLDPVYGTLDDLDDLIHEASRRNIRVLLDLDPQIPAADLPNVARFWLNRGIAGFHVTGATRDAHAQAAELRKATGAYLGQRILIGDVDPTLPSSPQQRTYKAPDTDTPQLLLDASLGTVTPLNPAAIRSAIQSTENIAIAGRAIPLLATDGPSFQRSMSRYADGKNDLAIAKLLATILFTTRAQPLLYYGQELGAHRAVSLRLHTRKHSHLPHHLLGRSPATRQRHPRAAAARDRNSVAERSIRRCRPKLPPQLVPPTHQPPSQQLND